MIILIYIYPVDELELISCSCTLILNCKRLESEYDYKSRLERDANKKYQLQNKLKDFGIYSLDNLFLNELLYISKNRKLNGEI